jgi:methionyl-tRNA synthetase
MKKPKFINLGLLTLLVITSFFISCSKENAPDKTKIENSLVTKEFKIVTADEYNRSTDQEKKLYDKINATVMALDVLKSDDMEAIISVSKNRDDMFSNAIIIAKSESNNSLTAKGGNCKVCGVSSAYSCLKRMQKEVTSNEFDVHVKRNGDCVTLSWK